MEKIYKSIRAAALLLCATVSLSSQGQVSYCSSSPFSTADEEIYNVMLNGSMTNPLYSFNNGCGTAAPGPGSILSRYSNFTTLGVLANIFTGTTVSTFSVQEDECDGPTYYPNGIAIWIDFNQNGVFTDPGENIYLDNSTVVSPRTVSGTFTVPASALTGTTVMRIVCAEGVSGSGLTPCLSYGYGETEDYLVRILPPVPCAGAPGANAVTGPTAEICPGSIASLALANSYTVLGITYQWQSSTVSASGPWSNVPTGTVSATSGTFVSYVTPTLNIPTWYQAVITCANNTNTPTNSSALSVSIAATTTNSIPYFEGFEGIGLANQLPNCSWSATSPTTVARTYLSATTQNRIPRTGNKFASFYYLPSGTNYFYTNGLRLEAGVTYSAALWYTTEYFGYTTWTDLSILLGASQSTTGLTTIASSGGPAVSPVYKSLSNTFTVATSGIYYLAIRANSNGACCGYHLSWDDLSVTIPCSLNSVSVNLSSSTPTICQGASVNITATGADTYSWNVGSTTNTITANPNSNMSYIVTGTSTLTGCANTATQNITVNPSPVVSIFSGNTSVCLGKSITLFAYGAQNYLWSNSTSGANTNVSPTAPTTYSVQGVNQFGCSNTASIQIGIFALPNINVSATSTQICLGEAATLNATGATSYQWTSNSVFIQGSSAVVMPNQTTAYVVTGTDNNGCSKTATVSLSVSACTSIKEVASGLNVNVYPNPTYTGEFTIAFTNSSERLIEVMDVTGRLIEKKQSSDENVKCNISNLASGIYYVKITSGNSFDVVKIMKE